MRAKGTLQATTAAGAPPPVNGSGHGAAWKSNVLWVELLALPVLHWFVLKAGSMLDGPFKP